MLCKMSAKRKVMYICMNCAKVVDTKDKRRHSRNCSVKKSPGLYEEPDVISSSDEENEVETELQDKVQDEIHDQVKDETTLIINAVRKRQPLWDNRMGKHERNPTNLAQLWSEVDEETGLTRGKPKTNWGLIRHRFNFERRKVEAGNKTSWPHYTPLLFLIATRQGKQNSPAITPKTSTPKNAVLQPAVSKGAVPKVATPKVVIPKMFEPKKKKVETQSPSNATSNSASNDQQVLNETHQLIPAASKRGRTTRSNIEPLYALPLPSISMDESNKREVSFSSSDSDVSVVEEINMNGSMIRRHIENPVSYKRVCIRQMQETQVQNLDNDDDDDDEIRRFCSYLEVMLRKLPKPHQEMFCEETLDHLASVNRKLRRSNF